ncbi:MAG: 16S rRNA (guanine(966)-N(2))-methyltransferase RsmD [Oscillospiraceae bacterium]|nr:16S rRNA (guanine(966)-N(2))-methyltransferase RsmD [Oscillospiraceae bacterium]
MKIITGSARGVALRTLPGAHTRPTTQRIKEALFSAIQFDVEGREALDLFAGSGALGIEALSRGAAHCTFVDNNPAAVEVIRRNLAAARLEEKATVRRQDAAACIAAMREPVDLVFLDPPYEANLLAPTLALLAPKIRSGGVVMAESDAEIQLPEQIGGLALAKAYRYGRTVIYKYLKGETI